MIPVIQEIRFLLVGGHHHWGARALKTLNFFFILHQSFQRCTTRSTAVSKLLLAATICHAVRRGHPYTRQGDPHSVLRFIHACWLNMRHDAPCPRPFKVHQHLALYFERKKGQKVAPKYASDNDQCRAVDGWSMQLQGLNDDGLQVAVFLCSPKLWYKLERILKILCKVNTCLFLTTRNKWTILKEIYNQSTSADREWGNSAYIMHTRVVYLLTQISHVQCLKLEWRINLDHREVTCKETKLIKVKVQTRNESGKSLETCKK